MTVRAVTRPDDPAVAAFAALMRRTLGSPDLCLPPERIAAFLAASPAGGRSFHLLVLEHRGQVVGASLFSYLFAPGTAFSEYMLLDAEWRGRGWGRRLFEARLAFLQAQGPLAGIFIEVENPRRTPPAVAAGEAMDLRLRRRIFAHMGFLHVDIPYVQPPLAPGQAAVQYLDLLFYPLQPAAALPAEVVLQSLAPIWQSWSPATWEAELGRLAAHLGGRPAALRPVLDDG